MSFFKRLDLKEQAHIIRDRAIANKKRLNNFLQAYVIDDISKFSLNKWIANEFWKMEENYNKESQPEYTYWFSGGTSWLYLHKTSAYYTEEEKISLSPGFYDIHYLYINSKLAEKKAQEVYAILANLRTILETKGIKTKIITTSFTCDESTNTFTFDYVNRPFFKEPNFGLKLVFDNGQVGGVKSSHGRGKPKTKQSKSIFSEKQIRQEFLRIMMENPLPVTINQDELAEFLEIMNERSLVEIEIDSYRKGSNLTPHKINLFNKHYLITYKGAYEERSFSPIKDITTIQTTLNRLNPLGMLTYSYLKTTNKEQEMGLNIDNYRQQFYFNKELRGNKQLIAKTLKKIIETYNLIFSNTLSYNKFFIKNLELLETKYSIPGYEDFSDFIEKWFMSLFRKAINSFITEINNELFEKYGVRLFIAGGDAMRRFDNDISFTKDIDTKLYIGTVLDKKQEIIDIIAVHIVKLRNYLEENYEKLLTVKTIEVDRNGNNVEKILNYEDGTISFLYMNSDDGIANKYDVKLKIKEAQQQFRVREKKRTKIYPLDLYSIDFETTMIQSEIFNSSKPAIEKKINISILDVVLQEEPIKPHYLSVVDNVPVASLEFLIEDLETTYTTDERALARISSGKYIKDIQRYNQLLKLYDNKMERVDNDAIKFNPQNTERMMEVLKTNFENLRDKIEASSLKQEIKRMFYIFLYKVENRLPFNIFDIIITSKILLFFHQYKEDFMPLYRLIYDISTFKINIFNENLNNFEKAYYSYVEKDDVIFNNYLPLFRYLINLDDGKDKHTIPFLNRLIKSEFTKAKLTDEPNRTNTKSQKRTRTSPPSSQQPVTKKPSTKRSSKPASNQVSPPLAPTPPAPVQVTRTGRVSKPPSRL